MNNNNNNRGQKDTFFFVLRGICIFSCIAAFVLVGYENMAEFAAKKSTQVTQMRANPKGIPLPQITVCPESGYKTEGSFFRLEDYLRQTYSQADLFEDKMAVNMQRNEEQDLVMDTLFTPFRGRCYTLRFFDTPVRHR